MKLTCTNCGHSYYTGLPPSHCEECGVRLVGQLGDGLPTQGEQYESELSQWRCTCGKPSTPGVLHRTDAPCYYVEATNT